MRTKLTFIMSLILTVTLSMSAINLSAQDDEENVSSAPEGPKITIISGFKGGSYYQMAKDMQKMTRKLYGKPVMITTQKEVVSIENGDTLKDEEGNPIMDQIDVKKPTGDTIDFMEVKDSDGSFYNFLQINKSDVDLTFLQYDVLLYEDMKDLKRRFKKTADIRILLPIGSEEIHLITTKESGIETFKDLKKKRVGIGSTLQGTNITAKYIKEQTKMKWEDVELPYDKAFRALFNGDIDAFFFVGAAPVSDLASLAKSMKDKIKLIGLPVNEKLKEAYGEQVEINSSMYSWVDKPVKTYAVQAILVTSIRGQTPEQVENLRLLFQAIKDSKDKTGYFEGWKDVKFVEDKNIEFDYHPLMKEFF